jgi:hypothetical protein
MSYESNDEASEAIKKYASVLTDDDLRMEITEKLDRKVRSQRDGTVFIALILIEEMKTRGKKIKARAEAMDEAGVLAFAEVRKYKDQLHEAVCETD